MFIKVQRYNSSLNTITPKKLILNSSGVELGRGWNLWSGKKMKSTRIVIQWNGVYPSTTCKSVAAAKREVRGIRPFAVFGPKVWSERESEYFIPVRASRSAADRECPIAYIWLG